MTTSTTPMPVDRVHPPPPSRWLLVGDEAWRQALQRALQDNSDPMLRWRVDFGLVRVLSPAQLDNAARDALWSGTTLVHLYCAADRQAHAFTLLSQLLDAAPDVQARAGGAEAPFDALLHALTQPDGLALARWLSGPRHRTGVRVYRSAANKTTATGRAALPAAFLQRADEAFEHWLEGFLDGADSGLLDEIYGPPDLDALPDQADLPDNAPRLHRQAQTAQVRPSPANRRLQAQGPRLLRAAAAASAAPSGPPRSDGMPADGCIRCSFGGSVAAGATPRAPDASFQLQWPIDAQTHQPARLQQANVAVSMALDPAAWASRRPSQLVLHPAGLALPVLVPIPATRSTTTVAMDRATFMQCAGAEAEFQLLEEPMARQRQ